jgi:predicted DNA-binding transcriptional regulator YafY
MLQIKQNSVIEFDYVNRKGEFSHRRAMVQRFYYGQTEYHPNQQWLLEAFDMGKSSIRTFTLKDMLNVKGC